MDDRRAQQLEDASGLAARADALLERVEMLEAELAELQGLATLGTLSGAIAHEFNNILTPIVTFAEMALDDPDDRELGLRALRKALEGSERASFIASALLGFARRDREGDTSDVARVVRDVRACLVRDPLQDGIKLVIDTPEGLYAEMSPGALHQVFLNLTLNALEAMKPTGGELRFSAWRSTWNTADSPVSGRPRGMRPGQACVEIEITDSGPGLPESVRSHLFEPFRRGRSRPGGRQGSGLGLSVCKRLVDEAGGEIRAESEPGSGTTFRIWLPATSTPPSDSII